MVQGPTLERAIEAEFSSRGMNDIAVSCPASTPATAGARITCSVDTRLLDPFDLAVVLVDDRGAFRVEMPDADTLVPPTASSGTTS